MKSKKSNVKHTPRAVTYARFSSRGQSSASLEQQIRACQTAAIELRREPIADHPGQRSRRSQTGQSSLEDLLRQVTTSSPSPFDIIVVEDVSRLGRNITDVIGDVLGNSGSDGDREN